MWAVHRHVNVLLMECVTHETVPVIVFLDFKEQRVTLLAPLVPMARAVNTNASAQCTAAVIPNLEPVLANPVTQGQHAISCVPPIITVKDARVCVSAAMETVMLLLGSASVHRDTQVQTAVRPVHLESTVKTVNKPASALLDPVHAITSQAIATASQVLEVQPATWCVEMAGAVKAARSTAVATIMDDVTKPIAPAPAIQDGWVPAALQPVVRDVMVWTVLSHAAVHMPLAAIDLLDSATVRMDGRDQNVIPSALPEHLAKTVLASANVPVPTRSHAMP